MSVLETNLIDGLAQVEKTGDIILLIVDHLPWEEPNHLQLLETKINTALNFVKSGEVFKKYPHERERVANHEVKVIFQIALKYPPNQEADAFLKRCYNILKSVDIQLECRIKN
ncbi:MAG: hypothetical protein LIO71_09735 [Ruminococcus sp.]|nr:hypothetical protein [Ruminococcus sp.]MCD7800259.1 hypothetical protein [Ruminococcus sp.]